ncbi:MAG: serine/threonine protein kinase [Actinomycetota bacterium]|nr:serine/threonine protein kinase [Actinomycetota bacterium]
MAQAKAPAIGEEFAGHRIEAILGHGGMGVVYLAEDVRLGRKVALKLLPPELAADEEFQRRFDRESRTAASLEHPHIVPVYGAGEVDGILYIAMRYIRGSDLDAVIQGEGPLEAQRSIRLLGQVADALDEAHARNLLHRDVKPQNILVAGLGTRGLESAYLTDFGLTKRRDSKTLTTAGQIAGTLDFMSPEALRAEDLDPRADVYSLGCVLYQCLTGVVPFDRPSDAATITAHLQDPPPKITDAAKIPSEMDAVVALAMAKHREDRYASCGDLIAAAREAAAPDSKHSGTAVAAPPSADAASTPGSPSLPPIGRVAPPRDAPSVEHLPYPAPVKPVPSKREPKKRRGPVITLLALVAVAVGAAGVFYFAQDDQTQVGGGELEFVRIQPNEVIFGGAADQVMNRIVATPQGLVAVGHDGPDGDFDAAVWISADGKTWSRLEDDRGVLGGEAEQQIYGVSGGGPGFVMVGYDSAGPDLDAAVWTSDGSKVRRTNPDEPSLGGPGNQVMTRVAQVDDSLVAVGFESVGGEKNAAAWASENGKVWSRLKPVEPDSLTGRGEQFMKGLVPFEAGFVGVGRDASGGDFDAAAWLGSKETVTRADPAEESFGGDGDQEMIAVAEGGPGVVGVGLDASDDRDAAVWTSADGEVWQRTEDPGRVLGGPEDQAMSGVAATATLIVAVGVDGAPQPGEDQTQQDLDAAVWTSRDGKSWIRLANLNEVFGGAGEQEMKDAAASGGVVVAVGEDRAGGDADAAVWVADLSE